MNKKFYVIIIAIFILQSGCKKELKRDELFAMQGCMAGGFGAAALVYMKKFGDRDAKDKAVIAGMMGCMAGAVIGHQIARKTQTYADAQTAADKEIAQNKKSTKQLKKYNSRLATNISDYEQQIETIRNSSISENEKNNNLTKTKEIVNKQKTKAESSLVSVEEELVISESVFAEYSAKSQEEDTSKWKVQIVALTEERTILSNHVQTLNALDASI